MTIFSLVPSIHSTCLEIIDLPTVKSYVALVLSTDIRPAFFVDTPAALEQFCREWLQRIDNEVVAFDIEEERGEHYHPRVALIQLSVGNDDAILDPIALDAELFEPAIEQILLTAKRIILHGGRNDVAGLRRDFGLAPLEIGDTQIAARFLGETQFGLSALLDARFGIKLSKEQRRSNWGQRPLTPQQLRYAQRDTTYLKPLWDELKDQAYNAGWQDAVIEECEALRHTEPDHHEFDPLGWTRIKGLTKRDEATRTRAAKLWWWRDQLGQQSDIHPSHILPKWAFEQAVLRGVQWLNEHRKIRKNLEKIDPQAIDSLHDALQQAPNLPIERAGSPCDYQLHVSPDTLRKRYDALHDWRTVTAQATGLDPGWLAPRSVLEYVARSRIDDLPTLANQCDVRQWRVDRYADDWYRILKKYR